MDEKEAVHGSMFGRVNLGIAHKNLELTCDASIILSYYGGAAQLTGTLTPYL